MPFSREEGGSTEMPAEARPTVRENVDAGVQVINLSDMRKELEAARGKRTGGGG